MKRSARRILSHMAETGGYLSDCDPVYPHPSVLDRLRRVGLARNEGNDFFPTARGMAKWKWYIQKRGCT